jgi:CRP-like cAMP-binding protein
VKQLLVDAALPASVVDRFVEARGGGLDAARFRAELWPVREVRERAFLLQALAAAKSERDKAALVFSRLDVDADGRLSRLELEALMNAWAMPVKEVDRWLARAGALEKGFLSFEDFQRHLRPVWRFIFYDVVEAHHGSREDMLQRALTAAKDGRAQDDVRRAVSRELAARVPFLAEGGAALLEDVSTSLVEELVPAGRALFTEGEAGDRFYLVRAGALRVTRGGERLAELTVGDYLGEGALLTTGRRSATATAVGEVKVLAMTRASFAALVEQHAALKASVARLHAERHEETRLAALHQALQVELLGTVPFLSIADSALRGALVQQLERREVGAGEVIFREGDVGDAFYLVGAGEVRIVRGDEAVASLGAGSWFGEGALLSGEPRAASAVTEAACVLYRLPRGAFDAVLAGFADVARAVRDSHEARRGALVRGLLKRSLLRRVPFLKLASSELLDALVKELKPRAASAGEVLMIEGERGDSLFLLVHGAVRVERGGVGLAELTDGAFFGERAIVEAQPRQATVVATERSELLELGRDAVDRLSGRWPELVQHLALPAPKPSKPTTHTLHEVTT